MTFTGLFDSFLSKDLGFHSAQDTPGQLPGTALCQGCATVMMELPKDGSGLFEPGLSLRLGAV